MKTDKPQRPDNLSWLIVGSWLWFVLVAIWATWTPIQLAEELNRPQLLPVSSPVELIANILLLAPVGFVAALGPWRRGVLVAFVVGGAVSLLIESGQLFLAGRIVSATDILLNATGAAMGGALGLVLARRIGVDPAIGLIGALVFSVLLAFSLLGADLYESRLRLTDWDPSYPIVVGDEAGGGKTFIGSVFEARICAGRGASAVCATAGAPAEARARLTQVAESSQHIEIHARVASATNDQWGPTRIITFSDGWYSRNATLGQEGSALVLRLRTPLMGRNGRGFEIWVPRVFEPGDTMAILTQVDHGAVTTDVTTSAGTRHLHHDFDALSAGLLLRGSGAVTPLQVTSTRLLGGTVLILPLLLMAGALVESRKRIRTTP